MREYTTQEILELMDRFAQNKLSFLELRNEGFSLKLGKETPQAVVAAPLPQAAPAAPAAAPAEEPDQAPQGNLVTSPIVGTFYSAPAPDKPPFVRVGQHVSKGDVLFIVESMKLMNEVTSEYDGTVTRILAENGQPVEYGTGILEIQG